MTVIPEITLRELTSTGILPEASRCLSCFDPPCQRACPAQIPIPDFIRALRSENYRSAARLVREANPMAAVCGEVCPQEVFCQTACTRGQMDRPINIRQLHAYATRHERDLLNEAATQNRSVAVVGAGPSGISCAVKLAGRGIDVTIFDSRPRAGGVPKWSIPAFRLSENALLSDTSQLNHARISIYPNTAIENPKALLDKFDAVFIATGLPQCKTTGLPGEDCADVISSSSFIENARAGKITSLERMRIVVIGGGNVSLDVASMAAELGAEEVRLLYRRGPAEMRVWQAELNEANKRGVVIDYLTAPKEFIVENGALVLIKCIKTQLMNKLDSSGRRISREMPLREFMISADLVIVAIGMTGNALSDITINSDLTTSIPGLFAGGDMAHGEGTIVEAVRDGKLAAETIMQYLEGVAR